MNRSIWIILTIFAIALLVIFISPSVKAAQAGENSRPSIFDEPRSDQLPPIVPGVVLVGLKPDVTISENGLNAQTDDASLNAILTTLGIQEIESVFPGTKRQSLSVTSVNNNEIDLSHIYRLHLPSDADVWQTVQELQANPSIAYAEPDYQAHIIATPNDPLYSGQWGLAQIYASTAWDAVTGTTDVVIAVVDSGMDTSHPDLVGQLWVNPGEIAGNGIDDDNNGYIDDINGWNILENNANLSDNTGHGTEVAGVIAATTNNSTGVAGVCWNCRLMVIKVTQPSGIANYSDIAAGVAYATRKGAKVINLSLGGYSDSATLRAAIQTASQMAVIVGGSGNDNESDRFYPAASDDYVSAVAGTTNSDTKVGTSNYGTWVDVSAPGEAITTTFSGGGYGSTSGTSMAAPFASGLAGLLRSLHPDWSAHQTRSQIIRTADDINGLNPGYIGQLGSGRINAQAAVSATPQPELSLSKYTVNGVTNGTPATNSTVNLVVKLYNNWGNATNTVGVLSSTDPYVSITTNSASFGTIGTYVTSSNTSPFIFSISGAPYGHPMPFMLNVSANGGAFNVSIPLTITTQSGTVNVSGAIASDTTWMSDKIYIVTGDVSVLTGVTLTIQPGTLVKFNPGLYMFVRGKLTAIGTHENKIRFTSNSGTPTPGNWGRGYEGAIFFYQCNDSSVIQYTTIEYGTGVSIESCSPTIKDNIIRYNSNNPANGSAITVRSPSNSTIASNLITNNSASGGGSCGGAIAVIGASTTITGNRIINNSSANAGAIGICNVASPSIINNIIWNNTANTAGAISAEGSGAPLIQGNSIANNVASGTGGLYLPDAGITTNNTVISNKSNGTGSSDVSAAVVGSTAGYATTANNNNWINSGDTYIFSTVGSGGVNATNNYWDTTDSSTIAARIYDGNEDWQLGIVQFLPFSTTPITTAPAFLWQLSLNPTSPVGIQRVTFDLTFSRPMDQSLNPTVTFGSGSPYNTYNITDNAQWLDDTHWRATYDMTSLVPRGTHIISVSGARGTDGLEIPSDTRFNFVVDYAGQITDQTPPNSPGVFASGKADDVSYLEASWGASDPDSPIIGYRYAVGSAPGATDIINWTTTTGTFVSRTGLGLIQDRQYWVAVQAQNIGGLWSTSGYRAFVAGQEQVYEKVFLPVILKQ